MREIKFRAWITENPVDKSWMNYCDLKSFDDINWSNDIMQFTWLLDKNGKEIYEWDVVKYKLPDEPFWRGEWEKIWKIIYDAELSWYRVEWEYSQHQHSEYIYESPYTTEIIWNIYENPELLK